MAEKKINVQGTFYNNTDSGKIAYASQIYDETRGKFQKEINDDLYKGSQGGVIISKGLDAIYKEIPIEPTVQGQIDTITDMVSNNPNHTTVVTPSFVRVPYPGVTFYLTLPDKIQVNIYFGNNTKEAQPAGNSDWKSNGDLVTFSQNHLYYRLMFRVLDDSNNPVAIDPIDDFNNYFKTGAISIKYKSNDGDVISRNSERETHIRCLSSSFNTSSNYIENMAILAHISDLHSDVERLKNCLEYSGFIGADAVLNSGDAVNTDFRNSSKYQRVAENYNTKYLTCIGNHEVWLNGGNAGQLTKAYIFENFIEPYVSKNEYMLNSSFTTESYYYIDVEDKLLRVIVLDTHYGGYYSTGIGTGAAANKAGGQIGKAQFEWFVTTLQNTPANYGVVVMYHENERPIVRTSNYERFYTYRILDNYNANGFYSFSTRPISRIIDAFIAGTKGASGSVITLSAAEANAKGGSTNTTGDTVTADFSNLNTGVEFICHVCGHMHMDTVGYYQKTITNANLTYDQLVLNVGSGSPFGGGPNPGGNFDLPRYWQGVTQDAFNVYVIDRYKKCVRIARIGSNRTYDEGSGHDSYMRDFMDIPYDNSNS